MRSSTAYNHLVRLRGWVAQAYDFARRSGWTHRRLLDYLSEHVWEDPALARCPSWVKSSLSQQSVWLLAGLYRPLLHGQDLERMLRDAREGRKVKSVPYLRNCHRLDDPRGREVTSDEISRLDAWERIVSATVWNHYPTVSFTGRWTTWKGEEIFT
jgi:hypothetical protein